MKNVLFVSGMEGDTRRYRCLHHQEQLALRGVTSTLRTADDLRLYVDVTTHDLVIFHRVAYSPLIGDLIELAHLRGLPVIFETDDLIFEPSLYGSIAYLDTLTPEAAHRFRQSLEGQAKCFALSDFVLTTTEFLAEAARRHGKTVYVHRNACSAEMIRTAGEAYALRAAHLAAAAEEPRPILIGYFSGSGSHNRDFALVTPALLAIMDRYPQVWLHIGGQLDLDARFGAFRDRIRRSPYVAWQELPHLAAQIDITLAPLELDNPFCQAKSEIKYTEAALVGSPTIASPTDAFAHAITHGENGLLAGNTDEWVATLTRLVENADERRRLGENARRHVYAGYAPEPRSHQLVSVLGEIVARYVPTAVDGERLPAALATAMHARIQALEAQLAQQVRQLDYLRETVAGWEARPDDDARAFWRRSYEQAEREHTDALRAILERLRQR